MKNNIFSIQFYRIAFFTTTIIFYQSVKPMNQCTGNPDVYLRCLDLWLPETSWTCTFDKQCLVNIHNLSNDTLHYFLSCLNGPVANLGIDTAGSASNLYAIGTAVNVGYIMVGSYFLYKKCQFLYKKCQKKKYVSNREDRYDFANVDGKK
jgi:hypothetical protein